MNIKYEQNAEVMIVSMPERLVFSNANETKQELSELIEKGFTKFSLDLSSVSFMDSSGLTVLVATYKKVAKLGGKVSLLTPSNQARMLIDLTRLHQVFDIFEDLAAAVQDLKAA
jgi:anti-sigma B factor antagonist